MGRGLCAALNRIQISPTWRHGGTRSPEPRHRAYAKCLKFTSLENSNPLQGCEWLAVCTALFCKKLQISTNIMAWAFPTSSPKLIYYWNMSEVHCIGKQSAIQAWNEPLALCSSFGKKKHVSTPCVGQRLDLRLYKLVEPPCMKFLSPHLLQLIEKTRMEASMALCAWSF